MPGSAKANYVAGGPGQERGGRRTAEVERRRAWPQGSTLYPSGDDPSQGLPPPARNEGGMGSPIRATGQNGSGVNGRSLRAFGSWGGHGLALIRALQLAFKGIGRSKGCAGTRREEARTPMVSVGSKSQCERGDGEHGEQQDTDPDQVGAVGRACTKHGARHFRYTPMTGHSGMVASMGHGGWER